MVEKHAGKITIIFIILQMILYVAFLAVDLTGGNVTFSVGVKYFIIILCFCYALFLGNNADKSILSTMRMALFFTLVSDLFILVLDYYYYGVLTFIFAQQLYGIRLSMEQYDVRKEDDQKLLKRSFLIRLAVQAVLLTIICLILRGMGSNLDELLIASILYFISIVTNAIRGVKAAILNPSDRKLVLFAVGIVLFLLCDINVGLFNLSSYIELPDKVYTIIYGLSSILMWTFYAPSQVILALSTREKQID